MKKTFEKEWGRRARTRIGLRVHLNREPTEDEVEQAFADKEFSEISAEELKQAFETGEEVSNPVSKLIARVG